MTGKRINKKELILSILESQGILSTNAIAEATLANIIITRDRLNQLEDDGLIESFQTQTKYTYWKLK